MLVEIIASSAGFILITGMVILYVLTPSEKVSVPIIVVVIVLFATLLYKLGVI